MRASAQFKSLCEGICSGGAWTIHINLCTSLRGPREGSNADTKGSLCSHNAWITGIPSGVHMRRPARQGCHAPILSNIPVFQQHSRFRFGKSKTRSMCRRDRLTRTSHSFTTAAAGATGGNIQFQFLSEAIVLAIFHGINKKSRSSVLPETCSYGLNVI